MLVLEVFMQCVHSTGCNILNPSDIKVVKIIDDYIFLGEEMKELFHSIEEHNQEKEGFYRITVKRTKDSETHLGFWWEIIESELIY